MTRRPPPVPGLAAWQKLAGAVVAIGAAVGMLYGGWAWIGDTMDTRYALAGETSQRISGVRVQVLQAEERNLRRERADLQRQQRPSKQDMDRLGEINQDLHRVRGEIDNEMKRLGGHTK